MTLNGEISPPFRLAGVPVDELFPDERRPEDVPLLDAAIDRNLRRAPVAETLERLDRHPHEIARHLGIAGRQPGRGGRGKHKLDTRSGR